MPININQYAQVTGDVSDATKLASALAVIQAIINGGLENEHIKAAAGIAASKIALDTDGTLAANSDTVLSSQKAVRAYVDVLANTVAGVLPVGTGPLPCMQAASPAGFIFYDGGTYTRATYAGLYAWALAQNLIGAGKPFGVGDGSTTFTTADLGGKGPMGYKSADADFNALGKTGGEKTHLLAATESGEKGHNHIQNSHAHYIDEGTYSVNVGNIVAISQDLVAAGNALTNPATATNQAVAASAAAAAHNNLQPYFTVNWMVKT